MNADGRLTAALVADATDRATTVADRLAAADDRLAVTIVPDPDDAVDATATDCVVVDGRPSDDGVLSIVRRVADADRALPTVLYGGTDALVEAALDAGVADVVRPADGPTASRVAANRIVSVAERRRGPAAHRNERLLSALFEHSSDRLSILDRDGTYTYVSPAVERLMGHAPADLVGESGFAYVHPADRERVRDAFDRVVETPGETFTLEYRVRDSDGAWRWVESRGTNRLDDPVVGGIVVNSREVTDRRERQRRLSQERAFTESIFAALPDVFYAFDGDGNFLRWNDRLPAATGYDDGEIRSMHPVELIAPGDRPAVADAIARVLEAGTTVTVEARFETKNGETRPYEFTGAELTRPDGEAFGLVGIGRDISGRKRRRRRFEAVFDNAPQFLGLTDTDGTVLEANGTVLDFVDADREAFVGRTLWDTGWFRGTPDAAAAAREGVERARNGDASTAEVDVEGAARTETIELSVRPITDDRGEIALLVAEGRRVTEVKRRERHLEVLHRFLRHNLRNKMTIIQGTADVLGDRLDDPADREYVAQIEGAAADLIELSETAHQLSRVAIGDDGDRRPIDLRETLVAVADDVEAEYGGATVRLDPDLARRVWADWRLRPVFEQLVENAVEHSSTNPHSQTHRDAVEHGSTSPHSQAHRDAVEHGSTGNRAEPDDAVEHSSTSPRSQTHGDAVEHGSTNNPADSDDTDTDAPVVDISCEERGDAVAVRISDNGPGIPEAELVGITTDEEPTQLTHGTGFGLWLARSVVDDYAGDLDYEPHPEGGSVVIVELPTPSGDRRSGSAEDPADPTG